MKSFAWSFFFGAALLAGCSGKVVLDTGATGGAGGSTGKTSTATGTICGGKQGIPCAADEFCKWDTPCGYADGTGVCTPRPTGCPADCPAVCGCDGNVYCNACGAQQAGSDVDPTVTCGIAGGGPEYHAFFLPTDALRYAITKTDTANDRCTVMTVAAGGGQETFGIQTTAGWAVEWVWMTPSAAYCQNVGLNVYPELPATYAKSLYGKGDLKQDSTTFPCMLDLSFTLAFDGTQPWAPATDDWYAAGLLVEGGCYD